MPKILHFEDDKFLSDVFQKKFLGAGLGYKSLARVPSNLLDIISEYQPDVILSNIIMPGVDGMTLLKLLKSHEKTKHIPFIFLTSLGQDDDIQRGLELGADKYLIKSEQSIPEVIKEIRSVLKLKKKKKATRSSPLKQKKRNAIQTMKNSNHNIFFERGGNQEILPTKRNQDTFNTILKEYNNDFGAVEQYMGHALFMEYMIGTSHDPRPDNVFWTTTEYAVLGGRKADLINAFDAYYEAEKAIPKKPSPVPKILLFEDERMFRGMFETKFTMEGFTVAGYDNPSKDPVSIILKEKPDLILSGVNMPVMNGFDAAKIYKADSRTKDIPLIIFTNLGEQSHVDKAKELGAADYMIKAHFTPTEVINRVREVLALPNPPEKPMSPPGDAGHGPTVMELPPDETINARIRKPWWKRLLG